MLSKQDTDVYRIYNIFGIKLSFNKKNKELKIEHKKSIKIQDKYDLTSIKNAKKMILFLIPSPDSAMLNGGIMSIFSLCEMSRKINANTTCIISTPPHCKYTYAKNDKFMNDEDIYRFL